MIRKFFSRLRRDKKGQGLVEYALLIAGVALISAAAVSLFGHKTSDMIGAVAAILPGAHTDDNNPIKSGHLIETRPPAQRYHRTGRRTRSQAQARARTASAINVAGRRYRTGFDGLIVESQ